MLIRSFLTTVQSALLAEIDAAPITMTVADLTDTARGRDLQTLGQCGLVRISRDEAEEEPIRFRYSRIVI